MVFCKHHYSVYIEEQWTRFALVQQQESVNDPSPEVLEAYGDRWIIFQ